MNKIEKCPECGRIPSISQNMDYSPGACECCGVSIFGVDRWNRYATLLARHNALREAIHKAMERTVDCDKKQTDDQLIADVAYLKRLASDYFNTSVDCGNRAFVAYHENHGGREMSIGTILNEILEERERQRQRPNSEREDMQYSPFDWHEMIADYNAWARRMAAMGKFEEARARYIQVAELAISAAEVIDARASMVEEKEK